jgi:competence protein ComEA
MFNWLEKYFTFSRTERNGIGVLLLLSFLVLLAPRIYFYFRPVQHADNSKYKKEIEAFVNGGNNGPLDAEQADTATAEANRKSDSGQLATKMPRHSSYFFFDPNKIGVEEWERLGFTEKQAQSIELYKQKGGKFYRTQDLMRLYVLDEDHYYKLKPYVRIDTVGLPKRNYNRY